MRVFDTFPFNGELDMLECRLATMGDVVDVFVIVEAHKTFQGRPKQLTFLEHRDRFARWADQIEYVEATALPGGDDPWPREYACREWARAGLEARGAEPADVVIVSDVDEILRPERVAELDPASFTICEMTMRCFAVDWVHPELWWGPVAARLRDLSDGLALCRLRRIPELSHRPAPTRLLVDAGWHLTWIGTDSERYRKLNSFSHTDVDANLKSCYENGLHVDGSICERERPPHDLPEWVLSEAPSGWWAP